MFYRKNPEPEVPIWVIGELLLARMDNQTFSQIQKLGRGLAGFIIARWTEDGVPPRSFLDEHLTDHWTRFDDDTVAQYPKIYKSKAGLLKALKKVRDGEAPEESKIGIALWQHSDAHAEPLERIMRLAGSSQFPGSPSQRRNPMHPDREHQMLMRLNRAFPHAGPRHLELIKTIDPTPSGKYIPWLVNMWIQHAENVEDLTEDADILHELLLKFHYFKRQLPEAARDIMHHDKGSLASALKDFQLPEGTKSELYLAQIEQGTHIIHLTDPSKTPRFRVIRLSTSEAARHASKGTAWCISSLEVAADYLASGPLILIQWRSNEQNPWEPLALAHVGYYRRQAHEEADPEIAPDAQLKDVQDYDLIDSPEIFAQVKPLLKLVFRDIKMQRMRKFTDAMDFQIWGDLSREARVQTIPFDWSTGVGQLEMDEEYFVRLIVMAAKLFGGRDIWIEGVILGTRNQALILKYTQETGSLGVRALEQQLTSPRIKQQYIEWAFYQLKALDSYKEWIELVKRING